MFIYTTEYFIERANKIPILIISYCNKNKIEKRIKKFFNKISY